MIQLPKNELWFATKNGQIFTHILRGRYSVTPRPCNTWFDNHGYGIVKMFQQKLLVHRLVWEYFNGPVPKDLVVNHIDGVKLNNNLANLELLTRGENIKHAWRSGLMHYGLGETANSSKLLLKQVQEIKKLYATGFYSQKMLANRFKVHQTQISNIILNKQWRPYEKG